MYRLAVALFLVLALMTATVAAGAGPAAGDAAGAFLDRIERAEAAGQITSEQALLYQFYYGFDHDKLPAEYRPAVFAPLKNATQIIWRYEQMRDKLSPWVRNVIDAYLAPPAADKATYISPGGKFRLTYSTIGTNAVPTTDTNPANGIPDFVEKVATYCDYSWDFEIDQLGFNAPPLSPYYEIAFEDMSYYGYTSVVSGTQTRITLHNDFMGFPPNDDPEGNQWGAAKVTVAHEFKHASQRATSLWSEGGWVELDATWMEDIAYDYVNDYYNYLPSGSPISSPATSLDSGGSGSYEDCVWQHFMSETYGNEIILWFWTHRSSHTGEAVMNSYDSALRQYGSSLEDSWPVFAAWNYATGSRNLAGFGYGEAADYPTSPTVAVLTSYPATRSGSVAKLAANFVRCYGFTGGAGTVDLQFNGADGSQVTLTAFIKKRDGTPVLQIIPLDASNDAETSLTIPRDQIAEVGFIIANSSTSSPGSWSLTVDENDPVTVPALTLGAASIEQTMEPNQTGSVTLDISNTGEAGSTLEYSAVVQGNDPQGGAKSVAGSMLACDPSTYLPGTSASLLFTVTNGSADDEWLTDLTIDFPTGITVTGATNFVGGTYGVLTGDGSTGNGALVSWHGDTGPPYYYGVIIGGESATASVNVDYAGGLSGAQAIAFTITGDGWGSVPHTIAGNIVLTPAGPTLQLETPNGGERLAIGDLLDITWQSTGPLTEVKLDLSRNGGTSWESLFATTPNDGSESWTVSGPAGTNCLVRVSSLDDSVSDQSDAPLTVYEPVSWLTVLPAGGAVPQGETDVLTLNFDTTGLLPGTYEAYLVIDHNAPGGPAVVPVTLQVSDPLSDAGGTPHVFRFEGGHPNPFNPTTLLSFSLPQAGPVRLQIMDVQGRLVRTVWSGTLPAGPHQLRWDGKDDGGRGVAAGTYLARLHAADRTATTKLMLAK
jgi:hypothetical protein